MITLDIRTHPAVIFAYTPNYVEMIIRAENKGETCWTETDIYVPERLSLSPDNSLRKGRVRIGIIDHSHFLEKAVRIYATAFTNPQMYRCKVVVYTYSRDGVIDKRLERPVDVRCELKKAPVL